MEEIAEEPIALLEPVTALDIGKAALTVRAGAGARPRQESACRRSAPASRPPARCWGCGTGGTTGLWAAVLRGAQITHIWGSWRPRRRVPVGRADRRRLHARAHEESSYSP